MGTCLDGLLNHFFYDRDLVPEPVEQATERVEWIRLNSAVGRRHPKFKRASKVGHPPLTQQGQDVCHAGNMTGIPDAHASAFHSLSTMVQRL